MEKLLVRVKCCYHGAPGISHSFVHAAIHGKFAECEYVITSVHLRAASELLVLVPPPAGDCPLTERMSSLLTRSSGI